MFLTTVATRTGNASLEPKWLRKRYSEFTSYIVTLSVQPFGLILMRIYTHRGMPYVLALPLGRGLSEQGPDTKDKRIKATHRSSPGRAHSVSGALLLGSRDLAGIFGVQPFGRNRALTA